MSDYNWCHGPECHTKHTQDRIRGVKGSKVLRTRKIKHNSHYEQYFKPFVYFCSQGCYTDFFSKYIEQIIAIAPRTEALETPINVTQEKYSDHWGNHTNTKIEVDNTRTNSIG